MKDRLLPTIAALLVLSPINFIIIVRRFGKFNALRTIKTYSYIGNDFPELLPLDRPLLLLDYVFTNNTADFPIHGPDVRVAWGSVYPNGFGFVRLGSERRILCVSIFHQLHCIEKMRRALDDPDDPIATIPHLQHCMSYIRQMVLCGADLTLEEFDGVNNGSGAMGVGVSHTCRDWSVVYDTVNENFARWTEYWETVKDSTLVD
ncbi:hypothetical protein A7U60_g2872 [Sanghuangporus baumii]|uniref:Oxidase ustYa n=1 Tax=Sanghuangporus baumii TaxID=108892 RepID=A0A9Q5I297_SANBA|nr:hypothetical protein A7U60_g2872 [Sanghuangporus baumii]